ncbi:MAG: hypothetical protein KDA27_28600, partial [Candidatus Eisenbacteria bacterium]|nr:hypothetical protein [Candidatus Eisenbacteria bacterium]
MRGFIAGFVLVLPLILGAFSDDTAAERYLPLDSYEDLYDALDRVEIDSERVADVEYLSLQREAAILTLGPGTLALLAPVEGRVAGAVFVGEAHLSLTPPTRIESEHLARVMKESPFEVDLESIVFFFADGTERELESRLQFGPGKVDNATKRTLEGAKEYLLRKETKEIRAGFARSLLDGVVHPYFFSVMERQYEDPVFFGSDPYEEEEVRFLRKAKVYYDKLTEVVTQFDYMSDLARKAQGGSEDPPRIRVPHYGIDLTLEGGMNAQAAVEM